MGQTGPMGYEVLDASGQTVSQNVSAPAGAAPVGADVVDLATRPDPPPVARPARVRGRRTALLVAGALVVGALAGSAFSRHQSEQDQQATNRATLAVAAAASEVEPFTLPIGLGAQLQVTVTNVGPLPIDVVATERTRSDTDTATRRPLVAVLGAGTSVAPGTSVRVEMRVPVDCRAGRLIQTALPVQTADGTSHAVPVTVPDGGRPPVTVCPRPAGAPALQAILAGTVLLPVMQLSNNTDHPMRVQLPPQALSANTTTAVIDVVTRPLLPTTIRPHDRLTVRLRFVAHGCVAELQDLQRLDFARLRVSPTTLEPGTQVRGADVGLDVTAVVAAAMVRSCG